MRSLLIDANYICWASHFKLKGLRIKTDDGDLHTGAIFGFLRKVLELSTRFKSNEFYFCFDGPYNKRKKLFPGYKSGRDKDGEDYKIVCEQINLLKDKVLRELGFSMICEQAGYEADDLIAQLVSQLDTENIIVSGDEDLYQLLNSKTSQYIPTKDKLYTYDDFKKEHRLEPYEWAQFKAIAGCSSDKIPGIPGMGPKKTQSLLSKNEWEEELSEEDWEIYQQFLKLTQLPFPGTPYQELWEDELSFPAFVEVCEKYEFHSLLVHDTENWERLIEGDFSTPQERVRASLKKRRRKGLFDA